MLEKAYNSFLFYVERKRKNHVIKQIKAFYKI